jgi:hypothetical protein
MENVKERLAIDHNALDVEWIDQPQLIFELSAELADERSKLERLKLASEVTEAEVAKDVREHPEKYGIEKVTEGAIKVAVEISAERQSAQKKLIVQKHAVEVLQAGVTAAEHKKRALESLVTLHGQQYFASPKEPRNLDVEYLKTAEKRRIRTRKEKE